MKSDILRKVLAGAMAIAMVAGTGVCTAVGDVFGTSLTVSAANTITEGDYEYQINGQGTVTIVKYLGSNLDVTIPSKIADTVVEEIGNNAFRESKITSVKFPSTLKKIGDAAFYRCYYLKNVTFPSGLYSIGQSAFEECYNMTKVVLPDTVTELKNYAFKHCHGVTSVTLSQGMTNIPNEGFAYTNITEITIPDKVEKINNYAFSSCRNLKTVNFGENSALTGINYQAFYNCSALESFVCPPSLEYIDSHAFFDCRSLTSVTFNDMLKRIGYNVFQNCVSLTSVTFPSNIEYIDSNSFRGCTALTEVHTGGLQRIYNSAFKDCISLKNVYCGEALNRIDNEAFYNTPSLVNFYNIPNQYIYLEDHALDASGWMDLQPDGIVYFGGVVYAVKGKVENVVLKKGTLWINDTALKHSSGIKSIHIPSSIITSKTPSFTGIFNKCGNTLESITFDEDDTRYSSVDGVVYSKDKKTMLYCPRAKAGSVTLPDVTETINSDALEYCNNITELNLSKNTRSFDSNDLTLYMKNLDAVNVPSTNTNFSSVDGVLYNKTKTYLYFYPKNKAGAYTMPDTLSDTYYYAFQNCQGITEINVPNTMRYLNPSNNFIKNPSLKAINVDEDNQWYASENGILYSKDKTRLYKVPDAYAGDITIPETVTKVDGQYAFNNCTGIKKLTIPAATEVWDSLFDNVLSITEFVISEDNTKAQSVDGMMMNLAKDNIYAIPKGVATITLPENIISQGRIRDEALKNCPNLETLNLSTNFNDFNSYYKFDNCPKLKAVNAPANNPTYKTVNGILYNKNVTRIVFVPGAKTGVYNVPASVNEVYERSFKDAKNITVVNFPKNYLNKVDLDYTFENCASLTAVNFADTNLNYKTVDGVVYSKDMKKICYVPNAKKGVYTIPEGVTSVEDNKVFKNCANLTGIVFPSTMKEISFSTEGMTSLTNITVPATVTSIGSNLYEKFPDLTISGYEGSYAEWYANYFDVNFNKLPNSISLDKSLVKTTVGKTVTLKAAIDTERTTDKTVKWTSSDTTVAKVSNGKVTAVAAGYAKITASTTDGKTAYCDVVVNPALGNSSTVSSDNIVLGDSVTITGSSYGGLGTVKYSVLYKLSSASDWTTLSAYSTTAAATFTPEKAGDYDICVKVKDTENTEEKKFFTLKVNAALANTSSLAESAVTLGESIVMLGNTTGGKGNVTYKYEQKLSTATAWTTVKDYSANAAAVFTPKAEGTYNLRITAKDSTGKTAAKTLTATVTGVLANTSSLSADTIKVGEKVTVKASATGGKGSYTYAYYSREFSQKNWTTIAGFSSSSTASFAPKAAGYYQICVKVKDAQGTVAKEYYNLAVTDDQPVQSEFKNTSVVEPTQIALGERVNIKASAEGGTAPYTYAVLYKKTTDTSWVTKQNFSSNTETSVLPSKAADYEICVRAKDAKGVIVEKIVNVKVGADQNALQNLSALASEKVVLGNSLTVNVKADGGRGDYTYAVLYKKDTDTSWVTKQNFTTNTKVTVKPSKVAKYNVCVKVKDGSGTIVKKYLNFECVAGIQNTSTVNGSANEQSSITFGGNITMKGSATGGTAPYTYAFYYKKSSDANWVEKQKFAVNDTVSIKPNAAVNYDVCIKVQDTNGVVEKKYFVVTVK